MNLEKVFLIRKFLDSYPAVISNQRKHNIKKYFIQLVKELENNKLTIQNISEGFIIYEKILIN